MDVNNVGQNGVNLNVYNSNNLSEYAETNTTVAVPQVQQAQSVENKLSKSPENEEYNKKDLDKALKKLNNFMKDEHAHAEYSFHKDFGTLMIKIVNEETKEVLLEIPPKKILDMVASLCRQVGLLDKKA